MVSQIQNRKLEITLTRQINPSHSLQMKRVYSAIATVFTSLDDASAWMANRKQGFQITTRTGFHDFHTLPLLIRPTRHLLVSNLSARVTANALHQEFRKRNKDVFVEKIIVDATRGRALISMLHVDNSFDMFLDKDGITLHAKRINVRLFYPKEPSSSRYVKISNLPDGFSVDDIVNALHDIAEGRRPQKEESDRSAELLYLHLQERFVDDIVTSDKTNHDLSGEEHARQMQRNSEIREALGLIHEAEISESTEIEWYETAALVLRFADEDSSSAFRWCLDDFRIPGTAKHLMISFYDEAQGRALFNDQ